MSVCKEPAGVMGCCLGRSADFYLWGWDECGIEAVNGILRENMYGGLEEVIGGLWSGNKGWGGVYNSEI